MKQLPNIFTLLNLLFGCIAIVFVLQNGIGIQYNADGAQYIELPEKMVLASLFIGIAALVDFFDGFVARLFNAGSEMGKQLIFKLKPLQKTKPNLLQPKLQVNYLPTR